MNMSMKRHATALLTYLALAGLVAALSATFFPRSASAAGIGVGPTQLRITNAVRGTAYDNTIFVQYMGDASQRLQLSASGDISSWAKFYEPANLVTPVQSVTVRPGDWSYITVKLNIPADTQLSTAAGNLWVTVAPLENDLGGMVVGLQGKVEVTIDISGVARIVTGKVTEMNLGDTEVGQPVNITVGVANTGNALANPKIAVKITKGDQPIADFVKSDVTVEVGKQQTINASWETKGQKEGNYSAEVQVSLGDKALDTKQIAFKLLPAGSVNGSVAGAGQLTSLSLDGPPALGINKIQGVVNNNGPADFRAKFIGEVYREGKLVDTIQSDEVLIEAGKTDKLNMYLKVVTPGTYDIKGYVNYGGNKSGPKEFIFSVAGSGIETSQPFNLTFPIIGGIGTIAIVSIFIVLQRRRRSVLRHQQGARGHGNINNSWRRQ